MNDKQIENGMVAERRPLSATERDMRDEDRERRMEIALAARQDVLLGRDCDFYPSRVNHATYYDNEQQVRLFGAIKLAASLISAPDEVRWRVLFDALRNEAMGYGEYKAEL